VADGRSLETDETFKIIPAIICITILLPSSGFTQTCSGRDVTTTPASPPNPRSYDLSRKQLDSAPNGDVDLVLLGDSLAEYWDRKMFPPISVVNLGVAGDKTQDVLWRLESPEWSKLRPHTVFIMLGTNNLPDDQPCAIIAGLDHVIARVKSTWPIAQIVLLDIPPRGRRFLEYNASRTEINAAMDKVPGIKTVNLDEEITCGWKDEVGSGECPNYLPHNVHFSPTGYEIILKRLTPYVKLK
jgi:lysophospholipase L1-like esterase